LKLIIPEIIKVILNPKKMIEALLFIIFILGLVIGSFLNVVIFRLNTEDKIVNSRSKCLACGHQLAWHDLFPVLSFLFLKGKCRYCKDKISWQYPLVEIATGILFVLAFEKVFFSAGAPDLSALGIFHFFTLAFVFSALVVIFVYDLKFYIIPDKVIYSAIAVVLLSDAVTILMDAESHLPLRRSFEWRDPVYKDMNLDAEEYDNYHTIDGLPTAFTITRYKNGDITRQYFLVHVRYNQELPADFWSVEAAEKRIKK